MKRQASSLGAASAPCSLIFCDVISPMSIIHIRYVVGIMMKRS
jgi:hypothetical protein